MSKKYYIKFKREGEDPSSLKIYDYDESITIRDMLTDFLRKTNSVNTLDPTKITFMSKTILNNRKEILDKPLGKHFKNLLNVMITIIDNGGIVGGNTIIY